MEINRAKSNRFPLWSMLIYVEMNNIRKLEETPGIRFKFLGRDIFDYCVENSIRN